MGINTEEIKALKEEVKSLTKEVQILKEELRSVKETLYLLSIPGMRESILEGMKTPLEECSEEIDW
jgi:PHD/YefM family antitoxin component YafN of YafNO toxin-antitoxin module